MCITYEDYHDLGYSTIPEGEFPRYANMAGKSVKRFITRSSRNITNITDKKNETDKFSNDNKRGLCEIADLFYSEYNQTNRKIAGFSNENYREQYFEGARLSVREQIWEIVSMYFTQEQLYRGIN